MKQVLIRPRSRDGSGGVYDGGFVGVEMYYSRFNIGECHFNVLKSTVIKGVWLGVVFPVELPVADQ